MSVAIRSRERGHFEHKLSGQPVVNRSDRWREPRYFALGISNPDANPELVEALKKSPKAKSGQKMTASALIGASKELILRVVQDKYDVDFIEIQP
jgi:hypothetical protein